MLAYTQLGAGTAPTLLLHGFLGSGRNLGGLARTLARLRPEHQLWLPDLPGHGRSAPTADPSLEALGQAVLAFARTQVGDVPIGLVGHSMGARVALSILAQAPDRVRRVSVLDMSPGATQLESANKMVRDLLAAPDHFATRSEAQRFFEALGHAPSIVQWLLMNLHRQASGLGWSVDREFAAALHRSSSSTQLWESVERFPARVAFLVGGNSSLCSAADQARLQALGCDLTQVPEAGHFLHVDAPAATVKWLAQELQTGSSAR